jgi:hypothetical protein
MHSSTMCALDGHQQRWYAKTILQFYLHLQISHFCVFILNCVYYVRFQVLTAASMKFRIVFWDVGAGLAQAV